MVNASDAGNEQSMFVLAIWEKLRETRLKLFATKCISLIKKSNYEEVRVKLTNTQISKLKSEVKNKTGKESRKTKKNIGMKNCHMNYF